MPSNKWASPSKAYCKERMTRIDTTRQAPVKISKMKVILHSPYIVNTFVLACRLSAMILARHRLGGFPHLGTMEDVSS